MFSKLKLIRGPVVKVKVDKRSCFQGRGTLAVIFQGLQGQGYMEVMFSKSKLTRGPVFKVRTPSATCKAVLMLGGEDAGTGCAGRGLTA